MVVRNFFKTMAFSNSMLYSSGNVRTISTKRLFPLTKFGRTIHGPTKEWRIGKSTPRWLTTSRSKITCLSHFHKKRHARMEPFAGYLMPIVYKNQTIKSEHMQTRDSASAFDVSHMMQTIVGGKDRCKFLEALTVADVENLAINKCTLSMFTNETGGIIDDCIIGKRSKHLHIVSNAANADIVWALLNKKLESNMDVTLKKLSSKGLIALQGPNAAQVLQSFVDVDLSEIEFMGLLKTDIKDVGVCRITRCGYTGEDGFEISVDTSDALKLMDLLCKQPLVKPAGLGARDTLRLEAGLCLHGHDITDKTTPVEAALGWTIHKRRRAEGGFPGEHILLEQLRQNSKLKRIGIVAVGSGPPAREGAVVTGPDGTVLGSVTSGNFAPKLEKNIAMAYLPTEFANKFGQLVYCKVRGKNFEYVITKMPFVKANYYFKDK